MEQVNQQSSSPQFISPEQDKLNNSHKWRKVFSFFAVLLIITVIGAGGYMFWINGNHDTAKITKSQSENIIFTNKQVSQLPIILYSFHKGIRAFGHEQDDFTTHIYRYDFNTKDKKEILTLPTTMDFRFSEVKISPDGKKMVYVLSRKGFPMNGHKNQSELWLVNTDGSQNTLVFADEKDDINQVVDLFWSPDSDAFVFSDGYFGQKYKVSIAHKKPQKINLPSQSRIAGWFSNSKLGFTIADWEGCIGECFHSKENAFFANLDGTSQEQVYKPKEKEFSPAYYWLYKGNGIIRDLRDEKYYYDIKTKKEMIITGIPQIRTATIFPKSDSILLSTLDRTHKLYRLDVSLAGIKQKEIPISQDEINKQREIWSIFISPNEKFYMVLKSSPTGVKDNTPIDGENNIIELMDSSGRHISRVEQQNGRALGFISD